MLGVCQHPLANAHGSNDTVGSSSCCTIAPSQLLDRQTILRRLAWTGGRGAAQPHLRHWRRT